MKEYKIKFIPQNKEVTVLAGTTVMQAGKSVGITMEAPCGGHGTCGKCMVRCYGLNAEPTAAEKEKIKPELLTDGWRLACRTIINQNMVVEVPEQGKGRLIKGALAEAKIDWITEPALLKEHLSIDKPSLIDQRADWERVQDLLSVFQTKVDLSLLKQLPGLLRQTPDLTAVTFQGELMALEPGDTTEYAFGCAVDIGTTTVVCSLHDLRTGRQLAIATAFNPQRAYGADVLARIDFSLADANLEKLQSLIVEQINSLIEEVRVQADIDREKIYVLSVVGNTTMQHLFLGLSPSHIAVPPFVGVLYAGLSFPVADLGIRINPNGKITLLPHVAGYVGADIVAGVLATSLYREERPSLLIDVGTNAEIVLAAQGSLYACSAAAGPAFEGANISSGMRAGSGAIDRVWLDEGEIHYSVIGQTEAKGLCGSGLIDVMAELLKVGLIDSTGRLLTREEAEEVVGPVLAGRLREEADGNYFVLTEKGGVPQVSLTQGDIRQVQLAKSAILAGIRILTKEMGIEMQDIQRIYLAGSFGNVLNKVNARAVGLIPPAVSEEKVQYAGNSAHVGAQLNLLRFDTEHLARKIVRKIKYIELSDRMDFTEEFTEAMFFNGESE